MGLFFIRPFVSSSMLCFLSRSIGILYPPSPLILFRDLGARLPKHLMTGCILPGIAAELLGAFQRIKEVSAALREQVILTRCFRY